LTDDKPNFADPPPGGDSAIAPFVHRHRVRYHEMDPHEHVYSARYLEYVDVAMLEFLLELGWGFEEALKLGFDPLLARAEIDFRRPAVYDEELEIVVAPKRLGTCSFDLGYAIRTAAREPIADVLVVYVNFDAAASHSRPIPEIVRAELERRLEYEASVG
jgi:acyl-CoA thioester hydrolase